MSKSVRRPSKTKQKPSRQEWPLVVYTWIFGLAILGYLFGRIAFDALPHPVHWASGLVGGILGCGIGWLWYRWRGDII